MALHAGGQLARHVALLHQLARVNENDECVIPSVPTQQELAVMVNTARETVSRALQVLLQKGIVAKDGRSLAIRDPVALRQLAFEDRAAGSVQAQSL